MTRVSASRPPHTFLAALAPLGGSRAGASDYRWTVLMVAGVTIVSLAVIRSDRTAGGTGFGLAIVKGVADAMGVAVAARSREDGQGACFTLRFASVMLVETEGLSE